MYAFENCTALTSIELPESVTSIGTGAFFRSGLISITLPSRIRTVSDGTFRECANLSSVTFAGNILETIGSGAFRGTGLVSVTLPEGTVEIGESAFAYCSNLNTVKLPESMNTIENYAFSGCSSLSSINIPDGLQTIGINAFENCTNLQSINLPDNLTTIGEMAFAGSGLNSVSWPASLDVIGSRMFNGCAYLESVTFDVSEIQDWVFENCPNIKEVNSLSTTPPTFEGYTSAFLGFMDEVYQNAVLSVPVGCRDAYFRADYWVNFDNIVETDFGGVESIAGDGVSVTVSGGNIVVEGAGNDTVVDVYNVAGQRVYSGAGTTVGGLERGVYSACGRPHIQGRFIDLVIKKLKYIGK